MALWKSCRALPTLQYGDRVSIVGLLDSLPDPADPALPAVANALLNDVRAVIEPHTHRLRHTIRVNKHLMDRASTCARSVAAPTLDADPDAVLLGNLVDIAHQIRSRRPTLAGITTADWCQLANVSSETLGATLERRIRDDPAWWNDARAHLAALDAMTPPRPWLTEVPVQAMLAPGVVASLRLDGLIRVDGVGCVIELKTQHTTVDRSARSRVADINVGALLAASTYDLPIGFAALLVTHDASIAAHVIDEAHLALAAQRLVDAAEIAVQAHHASHLNEIPATPGTTCSWCPLAGNGCDAAGQ